MRKLAIYALLAIAVLSGLIISVAQARPANEVTTTYYSGSNYLTIVGERVLTCYGGTYKTGQTTNWYKRDSVPCNSRY